MCNVSCILGIVFNLANAASSNSAGSMVRTFADVKLIYFLQDTDGFGKLNFKMKY